MSDYEAQRLWEMYQADPVSTHQAVTQTLAEAGYQTSDPRIDHMYGAWKQEQELRAYDAEVSRVITDPANADIDPELYHGFVAAAEGDFDKAVGLYRSHQSAWAAKFGGAAAHAEPASSAPAPRDYRAEGLSPQQGLHAAIEDATAQSRGRR